MRILFNTAINALMFTLMTTLPGCGSGGGSSKDTTAPSVSSTSPAASATGVARDTAITASFDEDMFATTVDNTSFTLASTANVAGAVSFDAVSNTASFTPDNNLSILTTYTATLGTGITDLSGNPLAANVSWSFTTADGAWGSAALIETNNAGGAFFPEIAVDASGNALAVWKQSDGVRANIWANRYVAGTGWGDAVLIENSTDSTTGPQVAVDANGNALAVWQQFDGTRNNIWANRYAAGTGWGSAELIETDNAGDAYDPQVAFDASGNAIAVWNQSDGARSNIWANRYAGGWGSAEVIETDNAGDASHPQVAFDARGNAIAVWDQSDGTHTNIWANRYAAGTGWGSAELIETDNAGDAYDPQVAVDDSGNAIAVWQQSDGTRNNIRANRYVAGAGWGSAALIETSNAGDASYPQIAVDASGNAIAVWDQSDGTRTNIWTNRYAAGSGWGSAALIETDNAGDAGYRPEVAVDTSGSALAVWGQSDGIRVNIWANRFQ
jgi:hypothetical protein